MAHSPFSGEESGSPRIRETPLRFEDLPEEMQIQAIGEAILMLADRENLMFSSELLSEALGPEQLRVIAHNIDVREGLNEEHLQTIAENIPPETVEEFVDEAGEAAIQQKNLSSMFGEFIETALYEHPAANWVAISVGLMMLSLYLSSPIIALAGTASLIITVLHYGRT